jgi:hypothetical protein
VNIIHSSEKIIEFFNSYIQEQQPCFISRIGGSDFELVCDYYNDPSIIYNDTWYSKGVIKVKELNGYFDFNNSRECFQLYLDTLLNSYKNSDVLAYAGKMEKHIRFFINGKSQIDPRFKPFLEYISQDKILINWVQFIQEVRPFLTSFSTWAGGKKILFVSPFSKSIEHQYQYKDKLFLDYQYPDFTLKTYNTRITYNNQEDTKDSLKLLTNNWHEECLRLSDEISTIDFDIALLSCGSYAMFLGDYIKNTLKKKALYFGGSLNLYFNIYGKRFEPLYNQIKLNRDYQIEPFENSLVENISGGRKYENEALDAYFGKK